MTNPQPEMNLSEALEVIRSALKAHGEAAPLPHPNYLERDQMARMAAVFQPRVLDDRMGEDEAHLMELEAAIGDAGIPKFLDPITVWWGGDRYYVIDGHHRLLAYDRKRVRGGIPVDVFEGTLDEAMAQSAALNSKNKLPMNQNDRLDYAWRLTLVSSLSKRQIVEACGISNGSVGTIRKVRKLLCDNPELELEDIYGMSWKEARMAAFYGEDPTNHDPDSALEIRATRFARSIARAVKDRPFKDPEAFARALEKLDARLPNSLMESYAWSDALRETVERLSEDIREAKELVAAWDADEDY